MKSLKLSLLAAASLMLVGCSTFDSNMTASTDVNPDINGDPSPIAVTVFELSDPISFEGASFVGLYTNPQAALGSTLLAQKSVVLAPGQNATVSLPINKNATYLGYIAAYRDLSSVTWEALVPVNPKGVFGQSVNVSVDASGIEAVN